MNERELGKLRAAAEYERRVAGLAADGLSRMEARAERDRARLDEMVANARDEADAAECRAVEAEQAAAAAGVTPGRVDGENVSAVAGAAEGTAV